ncbi:hypothetical protein GCM10023108_16260 [Saccharopolyspora hordei]
MLRLPEVHITPLWTRRAPGRRGVTKGMAGARPAGREPHRRLTSDDPRPRRQEFRALSVSDRDTGRLRRASVSAPPTSHADDPAPRHRPLRITAPGSVRTRRCGSRCAATFLNRSVTA